jgi:hypothetical protein
VRRRERLTLEGGGHWAAHACTSRSAAAATVNIFSSSNAAESS